MSGIKYGDCGADVQKLQKMLNSSFGLRVKATGEMDDATVAAVQKLKIKLGITNPDEDIDNKTLLAIKDASLERTKVKIKGKEVWVTKAQYAQLKAKAGQRAAQSVQPYVSMANEAKIYWDAHDKSRKASWFWSKAVDVATGAKFPSKGVMEAAVTAANALQTEAKACTLTKENLNGKLKPIRIAFAAMDQYRSETFGGGGELVKNLELIQAGCVATLQVTAAIATAGKSWEVQVAVSAGLAAYEQSLKEVDTASKTKSYNAGIGASKIFMATAVNGTIGLLMKGGKLGNYMDDVATAAAKKAGSGKLAEFTAKAVNGGAQKMIEKGLTSIPGIMDSNKNITQKDILDAGVNAFIEGAALKDLGKACDKYDKTAGKHFNSNNLRQAGKNIDLDKSGEEAVKAVINQIAGEVVKKALSKHDPKTKPSKFEAEVRKAILAHKKVQKAATDASKKKKK